MSDIKVSIVVPVYNAEQYLDKCLEPLVNQTLEEIEILCVDDGSTDSSPKIVDEYAKKYPGKVKAFHKENGGEWSARTYGLKKATGEYVGFIDNDDVPEVEWARKLYEAGKKNNADIVFCGYDRVDLDTGKTVSTEMTQYGTMQKEVDFNDDFVVYANPSLWNKIYKTSIVQQLEFMPFRGANDTLFLIESYMIGVKKLSFIPDVLYHYSLRSSSQIHSMTKHDIENFRKFLVELKKFAIEKNVYEEVKYCLDEMAFLHLGLSWTHMVSYNKEVNMRQLTRENIKFFDENFPTWRKSKFFKISHCFPKGFKYIGIWGAHLLYRMNLQMIYVWGYKFCIDVLHITIKW